jgi:hypothetical protein
LLQRRTNDYFFATPNRSGGQRPEISPHRICAGRAKGDRLDAAVTGAVQERKSDDAGSAKQDHDRAADRMQHRCYSRRRDRVERT